MRKQDIESGKNRTFAWKVHRFSDTHVQVRVTGRGMSKGNYRSPAFEGWVVEPIGTDVLFKDCQNDAGQIIVESRRLVDFWDEHVAKEQRIHALRQDQAVENEKKRKILEDDGRHVQSILMRAGYENQKDLSGSWPFQMTTTELLDMLHAAMRLERNGEN